MVVVVGWCGQGAQRTSPKRRKKKNRNSDDVIEKFSCLRHLRSFAMRPLSLHTNSSFDTSFSSFYFLGHHDAFLFWIVTLFFDLALLFWQTMLRQTTRHLLRRLQRTTAAAAAAQRTTAFHSSAVLSGDALDMVDTFARRHCKFCSIKATVKWWRHQTLSLLLSTRERDRTCNP